MKPMRADAAKRRAKIIETASMLFVTQGERVKLEQVAAEAGVGIATLYRNFPTRDDLVEACVVYLCDEVVARGAEAAQSLGASDGAPADVLFTLVERTIPVGINVLIPALIDPDEETLSPVMLEKKHQFVEAHARIMAAARARGFIHESVTDEWVLSGLIHLYHPVSFNISGESDSQHDVRPLISIFLEGCEKGVNDSYWYGKKDQ